MPALVRAVVEKVLVKRCRDPLAKASMSLDFDGTNDDLDDPIASALEGLGIPPQDRTAVNDADLAYVVEPFQAQFLDLATVRTLETALRQLMTRATTRKLPDVELQYSNLVPNLRSLIDDLWEQYLIRYARSGAPAVAPMNESVRHRFDGERFYPHGGGPGGRIAP